MSASSACLDAANIPIDENYEYNSASILEDHVGSTARLLE